MLLHQARKEPAAGERHRDQDLMMMMMMGDDDDDDDRQAASSKEPKTSSCGRRQPAIGTRARPEGARRALTQQTNQLRELRLLFAHDDPLRDERVRLARLHQRTANLLGARVSTGSADGTAHAVGHVFSRVPRALLLREPPYLAPRHCPRALWQHARRTSTIRKPGSRKPSARLCTSIGHVAENIRV